MWWCIKKESTRLRRKCLNYDLGARETNRQTENRNQDMDGV